MKYKKDIIVLSIICLFIILVFASTFLFKREAKIAYVYYQNKLVLYIDLDLDYTYEVTDFIKLDVKNGRIAVIENNCKTKECMKMGYSNKMPIICAYNNLVITFEYVEFDVVV